jgi:signal transduction histidine kinase
VLTVINSNQSLPEILSFIVGQATRLLGVDAAQIYQLLPAEQDQEQVFQVEATYGFEGDYLGTLLRNIHLTISYRAVEARSPQAIADTSALLGQLLAQPTMGIEQQKLVSETQRRFRAILALPLIIDQQVYGTLTLYNAAERTFSDEELKLATAFAAQSTLAIENARLRERVEHAAVAEERGRFARTLHDSVTQALYSLGLLAEACRFEANEQGDTHAAQNYKQLGDVAQQALREMRLLIYQLRSPLLEQEGLIAALQQRLDTVERGSGIKTRLLTSSEIHLPPQVEEELYWIVQEALNNALKHSAARQVTVRIGGEDGDGTLAVIISDDGVGFAPDSSPRGVGLSSIQERAARIGAAISVQSAQGQGTHVAVHLAWPPIQAKRNHR